jgi:hypothetical protein
VDASVLLATYWRPAPLARTLESVHALHTDGLPPERLVAELDRNRGQPSPSAP